MTPFFKATGGNEIEVLTARAGVQCWSWGSENGAGWAHLHTYKGLGFLAASKYIALSQYSGVNVVICKVGTA